MGFLFIKDAFPAVSMAFYSAVFGLYLPTFFILLTVAVTSKSEGWPILTMVITNIVTTIALSLLPKEISIQHEAELGSMREVGIIWPSITNNIIMIEIIIALVFLMLSFYVSYRKIEFI